MAGFANTLCPTLLLLLALNFVAQLRINAAYIPRAMVMLLVLLRLKVMHLNLTGTI